MSKKLAAGVGLLTLLGLGAPALAESLVQSPQDSPAKADAAAVATASPDCHFFSATNTSMQHRVSTNNTAGFYTSTSWNDLKCGTFNVTVPRGKSALAVVKVDGEVTCTAASATDTQWCQGRVLINGVEGQPTAPEPDSFAWSNSQTDSAAWESNTFSRTAYLHCPKVLTTATPCTFPVKVQVKNHGAGLNNRVDDATVDASLTYF